MNTQPFIAATAPSHFVGTLVEKEAGCNHGLHQISLRLLDDEDRSHIVYIAFGRGAAAEAALDAQYQALQIGQRYFTSATLRNEGDIHTYWMGRVGIHPDKRRARFAPNPAPQPAKPASQLQQVQP